jgi:hypothetical protein
MEEPSSRTCACGARWHSATRNAGGLGIGLDDAEYVGGVLWYGLTHRGGEGNPEEQKRVITDRLVRWATRDGGDSSRGRGRHPLRPGRAPAWTAAGPAEPVRAGRTTARADQGRSGPHSAQRSGQLPRSADADPFGAQSLRDGPCRHLPDQLAPGRQAGRRHGGQSRRRAVAPAEREGACARSPAAVRHGGAPTLPGIFTPKGCLAAGRLPGA